MPHFPVLVDHTHCTVWSADRLLAS